MMNMSKPTMTIEEAAKQYRLAAEEIIKHGAYAGFLIDQTGGGCPSAAIHAECVFEGITAKESTVAGANKGDLIRRKFVNGVLFYKYEHAEAKTDE